MWKRKGTKRTCEPQKLSKLKIAPKEAILVSDNIYETLRYHNTLPHREALQLVLNRV